MNSTIIDQYKINQIVYITNNKIVYNNKTNDILDIKQEELLEYIFLNELTSLKGRKDAIKKIYGYKNNPPLYLNRNTVLIKVEDIIK